MIKIYGALRKKFPQINGNNIKVKSGIEAVKALEANWPGFKKAIKADRHYAIIRGDTLKSGKSISEDELTMNFSDKSWHILPMPLGYGGNGVVQTIIGAAITAVGIVLAYTPAAVASPYVISLGLGIMFGGIAQMLAPSPQTSASDEDKNKRSYLFNGPVNSLEPGSSLPLAYGETFIGSIVASGGVRIENV